MSIFDEFRSRFENSGDISLYHAPGRVNLIGEHTDYNGGYVFPCALNFGTYAAVAVRGDALVNLKSLNFESYAQIDTNEELRYKAENDWANYPTGVIEEFKRRGFNGRGLDILYKGEIPNASGLSSSASIELVTAVVLNDIYGAGLTMMELVKLSQHAENTFVGVNCGIMDQFAVGMGIKDNAMLLNCRTLEYTYVPMKLGDCGLVISNTNKRRGLTDSKYNERRAECERAAQMLGIKLLGELNVDMFEAKKHMITDPVVQKRAEHIIYEDDRTLRAVEYLKTGDLAGFGRLLNESHESLKTCYEVTGVELDTLAEEAQKLPGVYGSRMTGAGFGGCTVSLVKQDALDGFIEVVGRNYLAKTGLKADFYIAQTGDGARKVDL